MSDKRVQGPGEIVPTLGTMEKASVEAHVCKHSAQEMETDGSFELTGQPV